MKSRLSVFRKFWDKEESLTVFLWLLVIFVFIIGPLSDLSTRFQILFDLTFGILLISGVAATIASPRLSRLAILLVIFSIITSVVKHVFNHNQPTRVISEISDVPALSLFLYVVVKQTMKSGPITSHRIQGAIATYLLLGLLWAKFYEIIALAIPDAFSGITESDSFTSLIYFSFVTLTTLGYGDIVPAHIVPRALSNVEALIGQLFPAIFIARLVSLEIEQRRG